MARYKVLRSATAQLDEIYLYTRNRWGEAQAEKYITGLFDRFEAIAQRTVPWRVIPTEFGVSGYFVSHERHFIFFSRD